MGNIQTERKRSTLRKLVPVMICMLAFTLLTILAQHILIMKNDVMDMIETHNTIPTIQRDCLKNLMTTTNSSTDQFSEPVHYNSSKSNNVNMHGYVMDVIETNITIPEIAKDYLQNSVTGSTSKESFKVPNLLHYCWYTHFPMPLRFIDYLGFMSAYKILQPDAVTFHLNMEPTGPYWAYIKDLPRVHINRTAWPSKVLGETVQESKFYTAGSDICRNIQIYHHGGIYLDLDVIVIKDFGKLRRNSCTLGLELPGRICGGIIICEKEATFMKLWANSYLDNYKPDVWAWNSGFKPYQLSKRFPDTITVLPDKLNTPSWTQEDIGKIWGNSTWHWMGNYAVHTWYNKGIRYYRAHHNSNFTFHGIDDLYRMDNCTFKTIAQYIISK